ncbi:33122_t:CDS:2, partial [Racocetra persica]
MSRLHRQNRFADTFIKNIGNPEIQGNSNMHLLRSANLAPNSDVHPLLLTSQSDAAKVRYPGETAVYRSNNSQHGMQLLTMPENGVKTIVQLFQHGLDEDGGNDCLGFRDTNGTYTWQSYRQISERITNFGSGLIKFTGLNPKSHDKFGIFMKNCPEWVISDLAACHYSLITVALPSIHPRINDAINQINLTEISVIVASKDTLPIVFSVGVRGNDCVVLGVEKKS